jgi:RNA polymerase sigma-70 factor (ECF subfamily)
MISESMFATRRHTIIEERAPDRVFTEMMNKFEQEILQTKEFQEAIQEVIKKRGRALQAEDIFDHPVLKQHLMDFIRTMEPITMFDKIVELYQPLLYSIAIRTLGNQQNAEDVVQESFMKAYVALKDYSKERLQTLQIRPWICAIVRNTAYNYRVRESRLVHLDLSEDSEFLEMEGSRFEQPEIVLMFHEATQEFRELICRLPQQNRAAILLRFIEDWDYQEVAKAMNMSSMGTLKSYMHRSIRLLRKIAENMGIQERDLEIWAQGLHRDLNTE